MRRFAPAVGLTLPLLAACSGGAPPAPPGLAYELPRSTSAVYLQGDTARVEVDAGGQTFEMMVASGATMAMTFASLGDGVEVTTEFEDFSARATNPMGPPNTASASEVSGTMVFNLDRRGRAELTRSPELRGLAGDFMTPAAMVASLFPRLPGRAVGVGETWTDTIVVDAQRANGSVAGTSVVTYTVAGDSVMDGRTLVRVTHVSEDRMHTEGAQAGFDVVQDLAGDSEGHFLWDLAQGLLFESVTVSDYRGSMNVSAAPFPMSVSVRSTSTLRLHTGM
jgi:hypothetical protein